jgi:hypothetical protein
MTSRSLWSLRDEFRSVRQRNSWLRHESDSLLPVIGTFIDVLLIHLYIITIEYRAWCIVWTESSRFDHVVINSVHDYVNGSSTQRVLQRLKATRGIVIVTKKLLIVYSCALDAYVRSSVAPCPDERNWSRFHDVVMNSVHVVDGSSTHSVLQRHTKRFAAV